MRRRWWAAVAVLALSAGAATGCGDRPAAQTAGPVRLDWRPVTPPVPAGAARVLARDLVTCAGRWFLVGAVAGADGGTRPAAWTSPDGRSWTAVPIEASSFYGRQSVLYAAGCRDGRLAALGAKSGGSHGNRRTVGFRPVGGRLVEVPVPVRAGDAPGETDLTRIAGGPGGWLIAGSRTTGATAWWSADAAEFVGAVLPDGAARAGTPPAAGGDVPDGPPAGGLSRALDAVATPAGWLVVGTGQRSGRTDPEPAAWTSRDGRAWRPVAVPVSGQLDRVVLVGGRPVAVGLRDGGFGAWRGGADGAGWVSVGGFRAGGGEVPLVRGLAAAGGRLVAATSDGGGHRLWFSADAGAGWRPVAGPDGRLPAGGGDRRVLVAAAGDLVVAAVDDGARGSLWLASMSDYGT